ncbi:RhoGAP-domain-containing protein [Artomyces pyxidatus]|uniref:RhoGAP-domain-containing protein n=1 Tax=Artomyces pyxidatus TaxID=48021 RepID=A0ACB8T3X6_9AGAM|nr:RhoGAP-domain-containing protein [Artomyces pyxidatus]
MSVADPPGRTSVEGPQIGPIPQFDFHLRILTDSYLSFFQERKRIEELYVDSLTKLHRKAKAIDAFFDDRIDPSTTRSAWNEVRDNVERETQARQAFVNTLTMDVINPLVSFKDTQERTRKRMKEDLKDSAAAHADYAENVLPKLKRAYLKKCQDVEDHRLGSATSPHTTQAPGFYSETSGMSNSKSNPSLPSKPVVTAPQPLRPLDRKPSGSAPSTRNRSPSTTTALSDLAHHGKKQLNQLITFLDKSGTAKDGLGGRNTDNALRSVRAKREADEADKEYRKSVHWLETLRLRRVKILEAGYTSLERFHFEASELVKKVLVMYADNMIATCSTQTHLATHALSVVQKISPEDDTSVIASQIPRSLASAIPKPILYYNYQVGECRDLIFGVSMIDYATSRSLQENEIPKIIRLCIAEVDKRGLLSEGIYRVSGRHAIVLELQHKIERNEADFAFNSYTDDVYSVSSLLKLYLRELPEPVFRFPLQDRIQHTEDLAEHESNGFVLLRSKIRRLPPVHRASLKAIVEHLARVASHADKNKMDAKNLAIVFGGVIFGEDELPPGNDLLSVQSWKDSLMETLIENAQGLFDDRLPPSSPPLPPAPSGEPIPVYSYGSSHTKVASLSLPPSSSRSDNDFAPQLPPRPTSSIHPSARATSSMPALSTDLSQAGGQEQRRENSESSFPSPTSGITEESSEELAQTNSTAPPPSSTSTTLSPTQPDTSVPNAWKPS